MSNLNENDIAEIMEDKTIYGYLDGKFKVSDVTGKQFVECSAVMVPLNILLEGYEELVFELSSKEIKYFSKKESYNRLSSEIINGTDFKALYGKNNEKVRKEHVKGELSDLYSELKGLEFSIEWIKYYLPFLKEVIRTKRVLMEVKE